MTSVVTSGAFCVFLFIMFLIGRLQFITILTSKWKEVVMAKKSESAFTMELTKINATRLRLKFINKCVKLFPKFYVYFQTEILNTIFRDYTQTGFMRRHCYLYEILCKLSAYKPSVVRSHRIIVYATVTML